MSENNPTTEAQPEARAAEPTTEPAAPQSFSQEDVDRIVADRLRRAKPADYAELKAKADRLEEIENAQKTEQQRHAEAAEKAKRDADEARAETLRYKAAATHGVGQDFFDLLGSGDEEAINARAERVGSLLKVAAENEQLRAELEALRQGKPAPGSTRPVASLRPGATAEPVAPAVDDSYPSHWLPQRQQ